MNPLVDLYFARPLGDGQLTALEYASKLWNVVPLAFSGLLVLAHMRWIDTTEVGAPFVRRVRRSSLLVTAIVLPVVLGFMLLAGPMIRLVYAGSAMSVSDIEYVVSCLRHYLPGAIPFIAGLVIVRALSARGRISVIAVVSVVSIPVNAVLDAVLVTTHGLSGLAAATSLVYLANFLLLFWLVDGGNRDVAAVEPRN